MNQKPLPDFRKGDVLRAKDLQELRDRLQAQRLTLGQDSGLALNESPLGTAVRLTPPLNRYLAVAAGNIGVRSGAMPGTGSVTLTGYDPGSSSSFGTGSFYSLGVAYEVLNASSGSMTSGHGIDSGMYCWAEQDADGNWFVSPLDCA